MSTNSKEPLPGPRGSRRGKATKPMLALAAALIALAASEITLRAMHKPVDWAPGLDILGQGWNQSIHRRSSIPGLEYELKPGLAATVFGKELRTNSLGMHSPEITVEKPAGVRRIVVLGDSVSFGWGVEQDQAYQRVLSQLLNAEGGHFQIINMAVSGYNSRDETALFLARGAPLGPDLIVIGYVLNDPDIYPTQPLRLFYLRPAWWQHVNLLRLARKLIWEYDIRKYGDGDYISCLHHDPKCWGSVLDSFQKLSLWARPAGVPVVVAIFPDLSREEWPAYPYGAIHKQVADAAEADGFAVLDLYPVFAAHPRVALTVSEEDPHPSALAHDLAARALSSFLHEREPGLFR
jgi:hypothetical protein